MSVINILLSYHHSCNRGCSAHIIHLCQIIAHWPPHPLPLQSVGCNRYPRGGYRSTRPQLCCFSCGAKAPLAPRPSPRCSCRNSFLTQICESHSSTSSRLVTTAACLPAPAPAGTPSHRTQPARRSCGRLTEGTPSLLVTRASSWLSWAPSSSRRVRLLFPAPFPTLPLMFSAAPYSPAPFFSSVPSPPAPLAPSVLLSF